MTTGKSTIYREHRIVRRGAQYVVTPYGASHSSLAGARRWIDGHIARERRVVRKAAVVDEDLLTALEGARADAMLACSCSSRKNTTSLGTSRYVAGHPTPTMAMNRTTRGMASIAPAEPLSTMLHRMGVRGSPVDRMERNSTSGRARGKLGVDVRAAWELAAGALYGNADRIVCAAREMLQNSRDATVKARRRGLIQQGEIHFTLTKQAEPIAGEDAWTLECHDNGPGMSCDFRTDPATGEETVAGVLPDVFFRLGSSGDKGSEQTGEGAAVGGFGMAKGIILGVSSTWRFEVITQRAIARSAGPSIEYERLDAPVEGTTVRVFDIIQSYEERQRFFRDPRQRVRAMLQWSNLEGVSVYLNEELVHPAFDRSRGRKVKRYNQEMPYSWGSGITSAEVILYKRPMTEGDGHFYVQIDGLYQFYAYLGLGWDVVVNLKMAVHAKDPRYPIPISRDAFKTDSDPYRIIQKLRTELTRDNVSAAREPDYTTELPTDADAGTSTVSALASYLGQSLHSAAEIIRASHEIANSAIDAQAAAQNLQQAGDSGLSIPTFEGAGEEGGPRRTEESILNAVTAVVHVGVDDFGEGLTEDGDGEAGQEVSTGDGRASVRVSTSVENVGRAVKLLFESAGVDEHDVPWRVWNTCEELLSGRAPRYMDHLEEAIEWVAANVPDKLVNAGTASADRPMITQMEAATTTKVVIDALASLADVVADNSGEYGYRREAQIRQIQAAVKKANPFAMFAVKVHKDFPRKLLRPFRRSPKKYLRVIMAWDATLRLIAGTLRIFRPFRAGFVFESDVRGMQGREPQDGWEYVYINPVYALAAHKVFKKDPRALALYFYGLACHELAHMNHDAVGHDERFVAFREDIGFAAAHVFRAVEGVIRTIFRMSGSRTPSAGGVTDAQLQKRLDDLMSNLQTVKKERDDAREAARAAAAERDSLERSRNNHRSMWADQTRRARQEAAEATAKAETTVETYRRLYADAERNIGMTAARLHAMLAFEEYLTWIQGPAGRELLPEGVDPARYAEALRGHPGVVAEYLLGDGLMKAKEVGEALAGHKAAEHSEATSSTVSEALEAATGASLPDVTPDVL